MPLDETLSQGRVYVVAWMGTGIYLPGLPVLGRALALTSPELSATLTLYYLFFACCWPLSDRFPTPGAARVRLGRAAVVRLRRI